MKQTSLAIATLISAANAVDAAVAVPATSQTGNAKWGSSLAAPSATTQISSRTAAFQTGTITNLIWGTPAYQTATALTSVTDANKATGSEIVSDAASSTCTACLGGGVGVWCSRTFSFVIGTATAYQAASTTYATSVGVLVPTTDESTWYTTTANDTGACCNSKTVFVSTISTSATLNPTYSIATAYSNVQYACPAFTTSITDASSGTGGIFNVNAFDVAATKFTSWWCSNGIYKNIVKSTVTTDVTRNIVQVMGQNDNNRLELAMAGCPNIAARCGMDTTTKGVYSLATTATYTVNVLMASGLTVMDKCSWVAISYEYAPTFQMNKAAGDKGLATANWKIHHMEFMTTPATTFAATNGLLLETPSSNTEGNVSDASAVGFGNYMPKFTMPNAQFATLRTWYGASAQPLLDSGNSQYGLQSANWFTPYQNPAGNTIALSGNYASVDSNQYFGNVANIGVTGYSSTSAATNIAAGVNYGVNGTGVVFDFRQVRYMPAQSAQNVWAAGSALNTLYTSKTTAYATAKTTWNAYVAILKKNAKMDAFAAAFSPPKAPTVPPLPNMPWTPAAYSGYVKQSGSKNALMLNNQSATTFTTTSQPTAGEFWYSLDAAQTIGGWGSWTAQVITFRNGFGKSFGTIGYSGATGFDTMSQIYSAPKMCGADFANQGSAYACDNTYNSAGAGTASVKNGATASSSWRFVTVISLWSNGNTGTAQTASQFAATNDLQIIFTGKNFGATLQGLTTISAPAAPTAADSLTGVAGASALAASSAAVLAIAALY